jgi:ubiquinone/menaquinone biosynthesis C-methylase UbiE
MDIIEQALSKLTGGRVLDVATQEGGFVQIMLEHLHSYTHITGIDITEGALRNAAAKIRQENIRFLAADAGQMPFEPFSFDTVSLSASLHHFANIPQVLAEIKRVLKPDGNFILIEMHREAQTEAELTSTYLHRWAARVDTATGRVHNPALTRQELVDHTASLGLSQVEFHDILDHDSDPKDQALIEQLDAVIDRVLQRAETAAAYSELKEQAEVVRQQLHRAGALHEPVLLAIGRK